MPADPGGDPGGEVGGDGEDLFTDELDARPEEPEQDRGAGDSEPELDLDLDLDPSPDEVDLVEEPPDAGPGCLADPGDPDRARVVLVGHGFGPEPGVPGTELRSLSLSPDGELDDDGLRLDIGDRPARMAFVPSGEIVLVVGEEGSLVSVRVGGVQDLVMVDSVQLPSADFTDLVVTADGETAFVVGKNVGETSGISTVRIGCDGSLELVPEAFFNLRLAACLALLPGEERAVLLGGQTVFEPLDERDVRLLVREGVGWTELDAFDIFGDFVDAGRIAVSPDGGTLLIPNGSPFSEEGGQVAVVSIRGDRLLERHRLNDLPDARQVIFAPDGRTALVTRAEPGRISVLADTGEGLEVVDELRGVGLADQMALVHRGGLSGTVLLPSVDPAGEPNVAMVRMEGPGQVTDLGQLDLGAGVENIPGAVAVMP